MPSPSAMTLITLRRLALTGLMAAIALPAAWAAPAQDGPAQDRLISQATAGKFKARKGDYFSKDCDERVEYSAELVDLNGDGQPEVLTHEFGMCMGAMVGQHVNLYIKDKQGRWRAQFGFPGEAMPLKTKSRGYPDIGFGLPGLCFPVWRWNGQRYAIHNRCADAAAALHQPKERR